MEEENLCKQTRVFIATIKSDASEITPHAPRLPKGSVLL